MEEASPFTLTKDIGAHVAQLVSSWDVDSLPLEQRELVMLLKNQAIDLRLEMRYYGMAETRAEQEQAAKHIVDRLDALQKSILKASEYNLLGPADVAQLSARLQQLISVL